MSFRSLEMALRPSPSCPFTKLRADRTRMPQPAVGRPRGGWARTALVLANNVWSISPFAFGVPGGPLLGSRTSALDRAGRCANDPFRSRSGKRHAPSYVVRPAGSSTHVLRRARFEGVMPRLPTFLLQRPPDRGAGREAGAYRSRRTRSARRAVPRSRESECAKGDPFRAAVDLRLSANLIRSTRSKPSLT
jgi:hypothetical protein